MEFNDDFNFDFEDEVIDLQDDETFSDTQDNIDDSSAGSDTLSVEIEEEDYITRILASKGIDRSKIQILDEDGNPTEVSFDELSDEDKYSVLNYQEEPVLPSDDEIQTLNFLRQNNMTLEDFAAWQRQQAIDEYLAGQKPTTEIDSYSDEEIIAYDFIQRFGEDMTDEEIDEEINRLKANPEAFEKRVALLRNAFKSEEEAQAKLYQDQEAAKQAENESMFINTYTQAASGINSIQNIELDDSDRDELLRFVLEKDKANRTGLAKAMDNPENVLKMAWYLLHGEETVDAMIDYFKKEIDKRSKTNPRVVTKPHTRKQIPST